jgi:hypothetical protein
MRPLLLKLQRTRYRCRCLAFRVVSEGRGAEQRSGTIVRIAKLKRLLVIGHNGFITFGAVLWLLDVGAAFALLDYDKHTAGLLLDTPKRARTNTGDYATPLTGRNCSASWPKADARLSSGTRKYSLYVI